MKNKQIIFVKKSRFIELLAYELETIGFKLTECRDLPSIRERILNEKPFALIGEYPDLVIINEALDRVDDPPRVFAAAELDLDNAGIELNEKCILLSKDLEESAEIIKSEWQASLEREKRRAMMLELYTDKQICDALSEIGLTANYNGTPYLKDIIMDICRRKLSATDSMSKVIYPAVAKKYDVTASSVERCIRTVIGKAWARTDIETKVRYFGIAFSRSGRVPTNREFICMVSDVLISDIEKYRLMLDNKDLAELREHYRAAIV